jgi:hypothetical protein
MWKATLYSQLGSASRLRMEPALQASVKNVAWNASSASCTWPSTPTDAEYHALVPADEQLKGSFIVLAHEALQQRPVGDGRARGGNHPPQTP